MSVTSRSLALLTAAALTPISIVLASPQTTAQAVPPANAQAGTPGWEQGPVDPDHPFSEPVYYPMRQYMRMDCYKANPGAQCAGRDYHKDWTMTLSTAANTAPGDNAVMAMGAGIFTLVRTGRDCGRSPVSNMGTTVQIDHGGGVISRYGHLDNRDLAQYRAKHGKLVAAGERIGTMGTTGAVRCGAPYLNFQVERKGQLAEFTNLTACVRGTSEQWPRDQYRSTPRYDRWNEVHEDDELAARGVPFTQRSFFPRLQPGERPAFLDPRKAPDNSCIPTSAPRTPAQPERASVTQVGPRALRIRLAPVPSGEAARVHVSFQRRSDSTWRTVQFVDLPAGQRSVTLKGLTRGTLHRVVVNHGNSQGWSASSPVVEQRLGLAPRPPRPRTVKVTRSRSTLTKRWGRARTRGAPVTGYVVGIRQGRRWRTIHLPRRTRSHRFTRLRPNTTYTLRLRAKSRAGHSPWIIRRVKTRA